LSLAFFLRGFPLFAVPGSGTYRLQPIFVEDAARLAVDAGTSEENIVMDAVVPDIFSFNELAALIAASVKSRAKIVHIPESLALALTGVLSAVLGDVVLTRDEVLGLREELLVSHDAPTGTTKLADWLREHGETVGRRYVSELAKH
jgi:uncharacterized protein YbjT (DUF2867 family)